MCGFGGFVNSDWMASPVHHFRLTSKSPYLSRGASRLSLGRLAAGIRAVHVLTTHTSYHDLGSDYFIGQTGRPDSEHRESPSR